MNDWDKIYDLIFSFQSSNIKLARTLWIAIGSPKDFPSYKWDYLAKITNKNAVDMATKNFNLVTFSGNLKGDDKKFINVITLDIYGFFDKMIK